jgi:hypothetical protein
MSGWNPTKVTRIVALYLNKFTCGLFVISGREIVGLWPDDLTCELLLLGRCGGRRLGVSRRRSRQGINDFAGLGVVELLARFVLDCVGV